MSARCLLVSTLSVLGIGLSLLALFLGLGIWSLMERDEGYYMERATCYTWEKELDSYYDWSMEMYYYRAQWRVDITTNITGTNATSPTVYYDKICLADTDDGVWTSYGKADDVIMDWLIGQNYTCWFNPDKIDTYPGSTSSDYEEYAFFKYDPDDMDTNDLTVGVLCLVFAGITFISMVVGLVLVFCIGRD
ncbi:hypothetical protein Pelo_8350 [Pelomyxa schiedti]|nr:hypothetical protein Pelo_8350 [Pelomyxa schiedti]